MIELKIKLVNNKRELENAKKKVHRREKKHIETSRGNIACEGQI